MPGFRFNVRYKETGPLFDAAATKAAAQRAVTRVNEALSQEAVTRIKARLGRVLRNPSGYYESRITINRGERSRGVWDNRVAHGGWLEGVDPRNSGRFKGYRTFRIIKDEIEKEKTQIAAPVIVQLVRELNGG